MNETKDAAKRRCIQMATQTLIDLDVDFTVHNNGLHIIIPKSEYGAVDFWPSTGRWKCRSSEHDGFGIDSLLKFLGKRGGMRYERIRN